MTRLLVALCLLIANSAFATTWKDGGGWNAAPLNQGSDGIWSVLPDMSSPNNTHVTTCTASSCDRAGDLPAPRGRGNPRLTPSATFPKANVAIGAIALAGRILPWINVGMGLYEWYKNAGLGVDPQTGDLGDMVGYTSAQSVEWKGSDFDTAARFTSYTTACEGQARGMQAARSQTYSNYVVTLTSAVQTNNTATCALAYSYKNASGGTVTGSENHLVSRIAVSTWCADIYGRATVAPVGGLCPGGTFQPITSAAAATRLNNAPITADVLKRSLEDVLKAGGSIQDTGSHSVIGPSSVPGETKTKTITGANGTTQVTTVTNNYNYNYAGNTITITTTEVIQNPDGSTETTTSDTPDSLCAENPNSLACIKLGDVPTDQPGWETKTIAYQADSLGLPAACPSPWTGQIRGWTLSFSYQPACDVAPQIRLAILALTTLGALLMIVTTLRT